MRSDTLTRLRSLVATLTRREQFEDTLSEELRFHLDVYADDLIETGMPRKEAFRQARVHFGSVERVRDECRQARGLRFLDEFSQDLRHGVRHLCRSPVFTAVATLTLALAIGMNSAIFSVVDALLLKPLPYHDPDRLAVVWEDLAATGGPAQEEPTIVDVLSWQEHTEPYRVCRRAFSLRGWSHVTTESVFPRSTRASGAAGLRARG